MLDRSLAARWARRLTRLVAGLVLYGVAVALLVRAAVGVAPWDVLAQGVARHTGLSFGAVTCLVGAVVLLAWVPLRQRPGVGTVLNVVIVGVAAQVVLDAVDEPAALVGRLALFGAGLVLLAVATGLYLGADLGPGPRDGLMTGLCARTGRPVWLVRTAIEGSVLAAGWVLGGDVGGGTLAFALLVGPLCDVSLRVLAPARPRAASATAVPRVARVPREPALAVSVAHDDRWIEPDAVARARELDRAGSPVRRREPGR